MLPQLDVGVRVVVELSQVTQRGAVLLSGNYRGGGEVNTNALDLGRVHHGLGDSLRYGVL